MFTASLLAAGLALGAPAQEPADCLTESGPVRLSSLTAQPPGGAREDAMEKLCPRVEYFVPDDGEPQVSVSLTTPGGDAELAPIYPAKTKIRATLQSSSARPLTAVITGRNARARFDGRRIVIQGLTTRAKYALRFRGGRPACAGETTTFRSYFDAIVLFRVRGSGIKDYRGSTFGSNAQSLSFPTVPRDGFGIELFLAGCGDGRARTREGFFQGFVPVRGLANLGLHRDLLLYLPNDVLDYLLTLRDNGRPAAHVDFRRVHRYGVLGVAFDYRLSYSFHRLRAKAIRRAIRVARRCRASGGELHVVRGRLRCRR